MIGVAFDPKPPFFLKGTYLLAKMHFPSLFLPYIDAWLPGFSRCCSSVFLWLLNFCYHSSAVACVHGELGLQCLVAFSVSRATDGRGSTHQSEGHFRKFPGARQTVSPPFIFQTWWRTGQSSSGRFLQKGYKSQRRGSLAGGGSTSVTRHVTGLTSVSCSEFWEQVIVR